MPPWDFGNTLVCRFLYSQAKAKNAQPMKSLKDLALQQREYVEMSMMPELCRHLNILQKSLCFFWESKEQRKKFLAERGNYKEFLHGVELSMVALQDPGWAP